MTTSPHVLSTALLVAHWLVAIGLSVRVIMRRRPVGVSLAWLAIVFSVPLVGAIAYLLVGETRLGRYAQRAERVRPGLEQWQVQLSAGEHVAEPGASGAALGREVQRIFGYAPLGGTRWRLLEDFQVTFDALVVDIDAAQHSCEMQFYIWHEGGRTDDVVMALVRAAQRGVTCRVLADALGSRPFLASASARRLREAGVEVHATLRFGGLSFSRKDLRNHRKIAIFDGRAAYTGSQNLVDPRFFKQDAGVGEWVDAMVRLEGPAVEALQGVFRDQWAIETGSAFEPPAPGRPAAGDGGGEAIVQVAPSGPGARGDGLYLTLMTAIYSARRELVLTTPYFVPDESLLAALVAAALRGVDVTLIVPARNDSVLVRHASVASFDDLAAAGVRIALFTGGLLHTKSLYVDGEVAIFGSVNLDMRSLWLNFEISLVVHDAMFAAALRALQQRYIESSELLDVGVWRERPARRRLVENAARLVGPLL